jgi:hypothetical protein
VTRFRGTCPVCGEVLLGIPDVVLLLDGGQEASYAFRCPGCARDVQAPASPATAELLQAAGAVVAVPEVAPAAGRQADGPPTPEPADTVTASPVEETPTERR